MKTGRHPNPEAINNRHSNVQAIRNTIRQVESFRNTLSRNKLSPPGSGVETAARNTGRTSLGQVKGTHHYE